MREVQEGRNHATCPVTPDKVKQTVQAAAPDDPCLPVVNGNNKNIYVLIHLLRWAGDPSSSAKQKVEANHWYLYRDVPVGQWSQEDFTSGKRLLGVTKVYVLLVQLNAKVNGTDPN